MNPLHVTLYSCSMLAVLMAGCATFQRGVTSQYDAEDVQTGKLYSELRSLNIDRAPRERERYFALTIKIAQRCEHWGVKEQPQHPPAAVHSEITAVIRHRSEEPIIKMELYSLCRARVEIGSGSGFGFYLLKCDDGWNIISTYQWRT